MPTDFVRYTPEIETIDPDLDRLLEQIIAFWEKKVRESPVVEGGMCITWWRSRPVQSCLNED